MVYCSHVSDCLLGLNVGTNLKPHRLYAGGVEAAAAASWHQSQAPTPCAAVVSNQCTLEIPRHTQATRFLDFVCLEHYVALTVCQGELLIIKVRSCSKRLAVAQLLAHAYRLASPTPVLDADVLALVASHYQSVTCTSTFALCNVSIHH